ncbi:N-acetylmuramoyl-L-alanine amidase [Streptomyces sp. NPDC056944]|uniref:N-acetylmuramoyl-L-alanine amidase n=1 Tax=Streptomyces sp. NPDC056944 TaxID=3345972 RepID=UPI00363952B8
MANPMSGEQFTKRVRSLGIQVVERPGWLTHNRNHKGPWGPVHGVMHHHTVTRGTERTVEICEDGYAGLPGPLCHGVIAKDGTLYMVGWGRANHAGLGDPDVLRAVIREDSPLPTDDEATTDGNRHFYGFESENMGDGKDSWPQAQLDTMAAVSYVICGHHGWTERSVIGHSEWQPGKSDPKGPGVSMGGIRRSTGNLLAGGTAGGDILGRIRARKG